MLERQFITNLRLWDSKMILRFGINPHRIIHWAGGASNSASGTGTSCAREHGQRRAWGRVGDLGDEGVLGLDIRAPCFTSKSELVRTKRATQPGSPAGRHFPCCSGGALGPWAPWASASALVNPAGIYGCSSH